ncbi:MAG: hypothetical protein ACOC33_03870, partial [bacterium]
MKNKLKRILIWFYLKFHTIMIYLSIALHNTEVDLLKADPNNLGESNKKTTRKLHHNPLLEKFYAGQRDEKYQQDYYELLKKADRFMRTATQHQKAVAADKWGMSVGRKDQYGRRYDHVGFFSDGHKHAGKTIGEVLELEMRERRTTDDEYELLYIFNNTPIETGLSKVDGYVDDKYRVNDLLNKSKTLEFPIKITRDNDSIVNKIEQLTEFLHVKKIAFEYRQLEFFIPKKFGTSKLEEDSKILNELKNIKLVYVPHE